MSPFLILAIVSCAACVVVKFLVSLKVKILEKELTQERTLSRSARKERNEALEESKLLKRDYGRAKAKQESLEQGLHQLAMALSEVEKFEKELQVEA
jgi:hypothetical protein